MTNFKNKIISAFLRESADKLDNGTCELSREQLIALVDGIAHEPLSKLEACRYLNISRSKFDYLVKAGYLPQGKKRVGFKELSWYKDDLLLYKLDCGNLNSTENEFEE